jgi:hypothetical protein
MSDVITTPYYSLIPFQLQGAKFVKVAGSNLSTGDTDLYTVPTGKKALLVGSSSRSYNPSVGSITFFAQIKVSGVYYRICSNFTLTTGTGGNGQFNFSPMVLAAGEILAINTATTSGLNIWADVIEYDALDTRIVTGRVLGLANGDNTIYTVAAGKTAIRASIVGGGNALCVANGSGASRNYTYYQVPSGGSKGTTNQMSPATAINDLAAATTLQPGTMDTGDFIVVNTNSGVAGQNAWVTVYEI